MAIETWSSVPDYSSQVLRDYVYEDHSPRPKSRGIHGLIKQQLFYSESSSRANALFKAYQFHPCSSGQRLTIRGQYHWMRCHSAPVKFYS
jgi:hypothetical protein